jgi:TRAP-type C4-dicarboxylate transport system permease small subunit
MVEESYKEGLAKMRQEEEAQEQERAQVLMELKNGWKESKNPVLRFFYYYEKIEFVLFFIGASIIMLLMFVLTAEVVGRYLFNHPIPGQMEFVQSLLPVTVLIGLAVTQRRYGQVRMDLFLGMTTGKARALWEACLQVVVLLVVIPCGVFGTRWFLHMVSLGDRTEQMEIPLWPFKMWIPLGFAMLAIRTIAEIVQWINAARTGKPYIHETRKH